MKEALTMIVTATEFKNNLGKYLEMAAIQDVFITKNGKNIARESSLWNLLWMKIPFERSG